MNASTVLLDRDDVPEHVRSLSSPRVIAVENLLVKRFSARGNVGGRPASLPTRVGVDLATEQIAAAAHLAGSARLVVVEGAAGSGKTATLAAAGAAMRAKRRRMLVVSPTLKAAKVAADQVGAASQSAAWLVRQHGYRWDDHGHWWLVDTVPTPAARLRRGDLLVVDEAGMLDQDTAMALLQVADMAGARLALVGDRHQLPAVGRGGVLDLAARYATACVDLDGVRRFRDPSYADLTLRMRSGERPEAVFDELLARGQVIIHPSEVERLAALASLASDGTAVITDTRDAAQRINTMAHHTNPPARRSSRDLVTDGGERISVGDTIATLRNDPDADVANRETWTVIAIGRHGLTIAGEAGRRHLPMSYARQAVELAYATTAYGIQGATVPTAHVLIGHHSSAASAYVAMTRGRHVNVAHLVADSFDDARQQWIDVFDRDRADLGPALSTQRAAEEIERFGPIGKPRYTSSRRRTSRAPNVPDHDVRLISTQSPSRDSGLGL
ncbi:AAA family ATPase [Nocardioides sp. NPDC047086]|uniref:ATP-dependent DNA helicase n=1 Tax=Nocardioides sp. NPDC047086 TaxID=3154810 RepID=UPI0033C2E1BB